jgi:hypothetical protein
MLVVLVVAMFPVMLLLLLKNGGTVSHRMNAAYHHVLGVSDSQLLMTTAFEALH